MGKAFEKSPVTPQQTLSDILGQWAAVCCRPNFRLTDIRLPPAHRHVPKIFFIHSPLKDCSYVFVRHDGVEKPL